MSKWKPPTKAQAAAFRRAGHEVATKHGAQISEHYDFEIVTRHGLLYISLCDDWIACRFKDVHAAPRDANPFSGKWNFHGPDAVTTFDRRLAGIL